MKNLKLLSTVASCFVALMCVQNPLSAQNTFPSKGAVGIGTITPNASAILDIDTTNMGVLLPRMTLAQRNAIATPATGLLIYQTNNTPGFYYYSGSTWTAVTPVASNKTLNNLTSPTAINQTLTAGNDSAIDLGSATKRWKNIFTAGSIQNTALKGFGFRPVFADSSGNIVTSIPALPNSGTNSFSVAIPDNSCTGATSSINLTGFPSTVPSVNITVTLNITHPSLHDLTIFLVAPNGDILTLVSASSLNVFGANFTNVTFSANGGSIGSASSLTNGNFAPDGSLVPFACGITPTVGNFGTFGGSNINPNGTWSLKVFDNAASNSGTILNWTITINEPVDGVWSLKGNSGTSVSNFIGTTDNQALYFRVNGLNAVTIAADRNFGIGTTTPNHKLEVANGDAIIDSIIIKSSFSGTQRCTAYGKKALQSSILPGEDNTAIGCQALGAIGSGSQNTAVGSLCLSTNDNGVNNTAIGVRSMQSNINGSFNVAAGDSALFSNQGGNSNTAIGNGSLRLNISGSGNIGIGLKALSLNSTGSNNIAIGFNANVNSSGLTNAIAIGANAVVSASNAMVLGNGLFVGIGTSSPAKKLHIVDAGTSGVTSNSDAVVVVENNSNAAINILAPSTAQTGVYFGNATNNAAGAIVYNNSSLKNGMQFNTKIGTRMVIDSIGKVGIGTQTPASTLEVNGTAAKPGGGSWTATSDARLKQNVSDYKDGLEQLKKINPVTYHYNDLSGYDTKPEYVGVLAQDLKEIAPYMVTTFKKDNKEYYQVDNSAMTYMLINAVKQLSTTKDLKDKKIDDLRAENQNQQLAIANLQKQIDAMQSCLETLCNSNEVKSSSQNSTATDASKLEQNQPNPFKENTTVGFYVSSTSGKALLKIFSMNGEEIKSFSIATKGKDQIEIAGNTLAPGVYTYVLIVDDKSVDTKQMVVTK